MIGEDDEVTGEFFSRLGEFSHAFRADSILRRRGENIWVRFRSLFQQRFETAAVSFTFSVRSTVAGETVLRLELCWMVSRRGRGNECVRAT